jgi:ABC-type enterobactin transport system permease subunit
MVKHERLYTLLLAVFAVSILCSLAVLIAFMALPAQARPVSRWPDWVHVVSAFMGGVYFCAAAGTLLLRHAQPAIGRRVTRALNIALLFAVPFGTALGLYGLWKVNGAAAESAR